MRMERAPCPRCGSSERDIEAAPEASVHYAKEKCAGCGRFIAWMPKPEADRSRRRAGSKALAEKYGNGYCELCLHHADDVTRALVGHHVIPYKEGGSDDRKNVWVVCGACHALIHHTRTYHGRDDLPETP